MDKEINSANCKISRLIRAQRIMKLIYSKLKSKEKFRIKPDKTLSMIKIK